MIPELGMLFQVADHRTEGIGRLENTVVQSEKALPEVGEQPSVTAQTLHVALTMPEEEAERSLGVTS